MHVLITGAGGHLGRKLFDAMKHDSERKVSGLDVRPVDHPDIYTVDLSSGDDWVHLLDGVDVIVHLAGDREPSATWTSAIKHNMDATLRLYHHAAAMGVSRVVVASSNWLHGDKRFTNDRLNKDAPPGPINAYGMSKLFCERTGAYFAEQHGLSVICLRIGWTQWTHDNKPGPHMAMGRWGQEMWLSDRDFINGMSAAVDAKDVSFAILNLMSNNPGMRWDIEETKQMIGYSPVDGSRAKITLGVLLKSAIKNIYSNKLPRKFNKWFSEW